LLRRPGPPCTTLQLIPATHFLVDKMKEIFLFAHQYGLPSSTACRGRNRLSIRMIPSCHVSDQTHQQEINRELEKKEKTSHQVNCPWWLSAVMEGYDRGSPEASVESIFESRFLRYAKQVTLLLNLLMRSSTGTSPRTAWKHSNNVRHHTKAAILYLITE
jgi:hypothetical protein